MDKVNFDLEKEINENGAVCFSPVGNSMRPFIKGGKHTVLVSKKTEKLKTFDVALYKNSDGKYVLHRIIEVLDDGYIFTGDFLTTVEKINEEDVIGYATGYFTDKKRKRFLDAYSLSRLKKVARYYKSEKKRKRYINRVGRLICINNKIKGVFTKKESGNV